MAEPSERRTAFALGGGGTFGAVHVGMLRALVERGVVPDMLVGTSVGALNAAVFGSQPDLDGIERLREMWCSASARRLFPLRPSAFVLRMASRRDHLIPNDAMRSWIDQCVGFESLTDSRIPLHVVATDAATGRAVVLSDGPSTPALLASSAVPGVFPPVRVGDRMLVDGAVSADLPIEQALSLGATEVWALPTIPVGSPTGLPGGVLGVAARLMRELQARRPHPDAPLMVPTPPVAPSVHLLPPVPVPDVAPYDFGQSAALISRAYDLTSRWLEYQPAAGGRQMDEHTV